jgi:hypothetical protein
MYKILGADGREYGPVPPEQIRKWIAEGRANGQTLTRAENQDSWKPLLAFTEFGPDLAARAYESNVPPAPAVPPAGGGNKSKIAAGLLGIFVGGIGIHRFYLGYTSIGLIQIVVTIATCGIGSLWGFVEGILILCGSVITTDAQGVPLKD